MLWCCILVYVIDRQWLYATLACCITSVFAVLGLIHQPSVSPNPGRHPHLPRHSPSAAPTLTLTLTPSPTFCASVP